MRPLKTSLACLSCIVVVAMLFHAAWLPPLSPNTPVFHSTHTSDDCANVSNPGFNPHHPPPAGLGPWFEGWYMRITNAEGNNSVAVGIGHFPDQNLSNPRAACFILRTAPDGGAMRVQSRSFDSLQIESPILNGGGSEDNDGSVSFIIKALDGESLDFCSWTVTRGSVDILARVNGASLRVRSDPSGANSTTANGTVSTCTAANPWGGPSAPTPERWLSRVGFLLRLRYNILSLRTPVQYALHEFASDGVNCTEVDSSTAVPGGPRRRACAPRGVETALRGGIGGATGRGDRRDADLSQHTGGSDLDADSVASPPGAAQSLPPPDWQRGVMHLEKNWGEAFPDSWIWTQGTTNAAGQQASFLLAGGQLPHRLQPLIPAVRQFVFSYHPPPPAPPFTIDPGNPGIFNSIVLRGCDGVFTVELYGIMHVVRLVATAPVSTFEVLPCPTSTGFRNFSVESFEATVRLQVLRRPFPFAPAASAHLLWQDSFSGAAMEFGGSYMCPAAP